MDSTVLQQFSSDQLIGEVVRRIKQAVDSYPNISVAAKGFSEEGGYKSFDGFPLYQQQLARLEESNYMTLVKSIAPMGRAADRVLGVQLRSNQKVS